ncbi:MAG: hypothetical protein ACYS91_19020, partial [Planctomycetota bacterium]|jgi:hypothetical protein
VDGNIFLRDCGDGTAFFIKLILGNDFEFRFRFDYCCLAFLREKINFAISPDRRGLESYLRKISPNNLFGGYPEALGKPDLAYRGGGLFESIDSHQK